MANENLFGAAVRNPNSPTFAYSGYNHNPPRADDHNWGSNDWAACLPAMNDSAGATNARKPWAAVNDDDGGDTFVEQQGSIVGPAQNWAPWYDTTAYSRQMLHFEADGPLFTPAERYTANYEDDAGSMMAKCSDGQVWHLTCNVLKHTYQGINNGIRDSITAWAFSCDENFATNLDHVQTVQENGANDISGFALTPNTHINYGSSGSNPLTAANASSWEFKISQLYYGNTLNQGIPQGESWNCIDAYFQINEPNARYISVRFDIDTAFASGVLIDRWALRPMNCSMAAIHNGGNSDISLKNDLWSNINTEDVDP